ncbi:MAG: 5'/3'-nucleotidase SurE [Myxococcales bacterium]
MRVLITNDDGFWSRGLRALVDALDPLAEVWVVAPDREQSAASHAISLARPLRLHEVAERRYAVDGTPTDCVYLALNHLLRGRPPDVLFSGINHGPNLADDVTYSGTVAGAVEGAILGVRFCAAFSLVGKGSEDRFAPAADFARALLGALRKRPPSPPLLLNINVPVELASRCFEVTRLGRRGYSAAVTEKVDPRGRKYYWIGGPEQAHQDIPGSDCVAVLDRHVISVTPLHLDWTSPAGLEALSSWYLEGYAKG